MKKKVYKTLGVVITTILLVSLMVGLVVMPAISAESPNIEDGPGPWARAIDGTFYAYAKIDGIHNVLKSMDAKSWTATAYAGAAAVDIAVASWDANTVYVLDTTGDIWKTTNDGFTWRLLPQLYTPYPNTGAINSIAVGLADDYPHIFAGTSSNNGTADGGVFVLVEKFAADWFDLNLAGDHELVATDVDVWEIALSPNFGIDQMLIAIFVDRAANKTFATSKYGGQPQWGATVPDAELKYNGTSSFGATSAVIWIPDAFDSDPNNGLMEYFAGVTAANTGGDVYRITTDEANDLDISGPNSETNMAGLDGVGNVGGASLLGGGTDGNVYFTTNYGDKWIKNKKKPAGDGNAYPIVSTDGLRPGVVSWTAVDGNVSEGAISCTRSGGRSWIQIFPWPAPRK